MLYEGSDQKINTLSDQQTVPIYCVPQSFGYSRDQISRIFTQIQYPTCQQKNKQKNQIIHLDTFQNTLTMNCPNNQGYYYLGVNQDEQLQGQFPVQPFLKKYKKQVKLTNKEEWTYGTCYSHKTSHLEGASYSHRPKNQTIFRAKQNSFQMQQKWKTQKYKPLTVLMLVIDSLSRKMFFRSLNHTVTFLNSIPSSKARVFDFHIHNTMGDNSMPSIYPVFTGQQIEWVSQSRRHQNAKKQKDLLGTSAIWRHLKQNGWITMYGVQFCKDDFSQFMGQKVQVDHTMARFWCPAVPFSGYSDILEDQRCIGNKNSHYYMLNYTLEYVRNYKGLNKWAHVMVMAAHQPTGTVVQTLDEDLAYFLQKYLETDDQTVIFLMGDHGMRYGLWGKNFQGSQEHKLPLLTVIASSSLLREMPYSLDSLHYNQNRLVSKFDLHKSLVHLSYIPYQRESNKLYLEIRGKSKSEAVSLFDQKISNTRSCQSAGIPIYYCSCTDYKIISQETIEGSGKELIQIIVKNMVSEMNYDNNIRLKGKSSLCQKVSLKKVQEAYWIKVSNRRIGYKIVFSIQEQADILLEGFSVFSTSWVRQVPRYKGYPSIPVYYDGKKVIRMYYLKRQDTYAGLCQEMCKFRFIEPALCVCRDLEWVEQNQGGVVQFFREKYNHYLGELGESCESVCKKKDQICDSVGSKIFDTCQFLQNQYYGKCEVQKGTVYPGIREGLIVVSGSYRASCYSFQENVKRVCGCLKVV